MFSRSPRRRRSVQGVPGSCVFTVKHVALIGTCAAGPMREPPRSRIQVELRCASKDDTLDIGHFGDSLVPSLPRKPSLIADCFRQANLVRLCNGSLRLTPRVTRKAI